MCLWLIWWYFFIAFYFYNFICPLFFLFYLEFSSVWTLANCVDTCTRSLVSNIRLPLELILSPKSFRLTTDLSLYKWVSFPVSTVFQYSFYFSALGLLWNFFVVFQFVVLCCLVDRYGTLLGKSDSRVSGLHFIEARIAVFLCMMWMWWSRSIPLRTGMRSFSNRLLLFFSKCSISLTGLTTS